jgi:hypothetical protein
VIHLLQPKLPVSRHIINLDVGDDETSSRQVNPYESTEICIKTGKYELPPTEIECEIHSIGGMASGAPDEYNIEKDIRSSSPDSWLMFLPWGSVPPRRPYERERCGGGDWTLVSYEQKIYSGPNVTVGYHWNNKNIWDVKHWRRCSDISLARTRSWLDA